ncbi:MAG: glutaredoxin 3 [Halioglobus sp.]
MDASVVMYSTRFCPFCMRARSLLDGKGIEYADIAVDEQPQLRREMMQRSGRQTVPQIWIGEQHIGGFDDLALLERQGRLDELLKLAS